MLDFMFLEHFFQAFLIMILIIIGVGHFMADSAIRTYPDLLNSGISVFKIVFSFFSKKQNKVTDLTNKSLEKYDELNEVFENNLTKFYKKTFYPLEIFLSINILFGYTLYFVDKNTLNYFSNHTFMTNISLLVLFYLTCKMIRGKKNEK